MVPGFPTGPAALIVAHPGHELRVHGWLELCRPLVFVLSDGSGRTGKSRLPSTAQIVTRAQARPGAIFGRHADQTLYQALLRKDWGLFRALADELAVALRCAGVACVVGDAMEGYNPVHDVCRLLIDAALRQFSRPPRNLEFLLTGRPDFGPATRRADFIYRLPEDAFARKVEAARGYAELDGELASAVGQFGVEAFRCEGFRRPRTLSECNFGPANPPAYERYGERQVAAGHYREVIRHDVHIAALADALAADRPRACA